MSLTVTRTSPLIGLKEELERQNGTRRDWVADTRLTSFALHGVDDADLSIGGMVEDDDKRRAATLVYNIDLPKEGVRTFPLTDHAHGQMATHLEMPRKFYDRMYGEHPDMLRDLCNGLLTREPAKRLVRTLDGKVRAFLSNRYRPRDNWDLLDEAVLPTLGEFPGAVEFKSCKMTETRMYIKAFLPEMELQVTPKVGDVIRGGVIIQNSEVGAGSLGIYPFTDRLICLNGMVHTDLGKRERHVGKRIESDQEAWELYSDKTLELDDQAFFAKCRDVITSALNEQVFHAIVGQMQELAKIKIDSPPDKVVEVVFGKTHGLTEDERGSMLTRLVEESDLSGWGYVNALTATARDLENADRQVDLEKLAGSLVADQAWALAAAA